MFQSDEKCSTSDQRETKQGFSLKKKKKKSFLAGKIIFSYDLKMGFLREKIILIKVEKFLLCFRAFRVRFWRKISAIMKFFLHYKIKSLHGI
jgi:hypothetical protein